MNLQTEVTPELWAAIRRSYESQSWSNAILDGIYYLSDAIRSKTGLKSDGTALAGQALGGKAPKLRLNKLQTESEQNVQSGVEQLLRGLYQAVRNPRSHDRIDDSQRNADALLLFVNYLLGIIGHARTAFSLEECVARILEENFVPNRRYADLILQEIPVRQRLQVCLAIYNRRTQTDGDKVKQFFQAALTVLEAQETEEFFAAVSEELRESTEESELRSLLQILNPDQWPRISEVARLRTENRLIRDVQDGRYMRTVGRCVAGALATWSRSFWTHFTLKTELLNIVVEKLRSSSVESQDYVLNYLFNFLESLADEPPYRLNALILERLKAGDRRFQQALHSLWLWDDKWSADVKTALASFIAAEETAGEPDDDDIPF